jgi:unsaturated rhamnogalacturonyl hydrolase
MRGEPPLLDQQFESNLARHTDWLGPNVARFVTHYLGKWQPSKPLWNYENGCIYKGVLDLHFATRLKPLFDLVYHEVSQLVAEDGTISGYETTEFTLDDINAGKVLFPLMYATREARFRRAIDRQWEQLARHPRTRSGNYWHKQIHPNQVWLDGLYMAQPFQLAYATLKGSPELAADSIRQFFHVRDSMRDPRTGLYFHGWDESGAQKWANLQTGCSPHVWAGAMGWFVMAMIDCLDLEEILNNNDANELAKMLRGAIESLARVRKRPGLWSQILDQDGEANYQETSASLMIAYAMIKSGRIAEMEIPYIHLGLETLRNLIRERLTAAELSGTCAGAGLGGEPYRDGSFAYYLSEPVVSNDPKGVGALFMAIAEALKVRAERGG